MSYVDSIRTIIADDEVLARKRLRSLLENRADIQLVAECKDGKEAQAALEELKPDLILLDIQMPEMDGIALAGSIESPGKPMVVFVTAYDKHAVKAFEVNALDYLLKPFDAERLHASIDRVKQQLGSTHGENPGIGQRGVVPAEIDEQGAFIRRLALKHEGRLHLISILDVSRFEAGGNYIRVHANKQVFLFRQTMGRLESRLDPNQFSRIHRSIIVNVDYIQALESTFHGDYRVLLVDGTSLPLSRKYKKSFSARLGFKN